ncbi:hypothetical protein I316_03613 [Kwoniella heveanensis BCC8398]|uniref:Uncharacterized protein n=1 Tax=Kwoniella heveanensis BCC8398 TaxID=1296120 RepID=A0A1B9GU45_9TREE|nr:hypothetical protein I316_03613 [Kwoniella heveanensis BCC8398]
MPLYKLTEKRMKKRAREDEQGITQIKAAMREMGDSAGEETDSDESVSGSGSEDEDDDDEQGWSEDSDDDDDEEESQEEDEEGDAELDVDIEGLDDSDDEDEEEDEEDAGSEDGSEASSSVFPISLEGALTEPIYANGNADDQLCVLCPDKLMKNQHMVKIHLESKGHKRAAKRYALRLSTHPPPPDTDPREVVDDILAELDSAPAGGAGTGESSTSVAAPDKGSNEAKASEPENEAEGSASGGGVQRKRKRKMGKEERRAVRAEKLLAQAQSGTASDEKADDAAKDGASGLNRKARRLLARRNGEFGDNKSKSKPEGNELEEKEKKANRPESGPVKKQKKGKQ